ncbi:hypothetical protein LIER_18957 [Lithospermum erythrorhizon]|uniref:Integrase catalytic domain-containing protein n=1 Tax=Lithospermum erythrorhizon TaxID=34254 RepID=A0AAV3QKB8_LITER
MNLLSKFQTFNKGTLPMIDYLQQLHGRYCSLRAVGEPLVESDLFAQILLRLPSPYSSFVTVMNNTRPMPSFAALRPMLLSEEDRVKLLNPDQPSASAMVLYSSHTSPSNNHHSSNRGRIHIRCNLSLLQSVVPYVGSQKFMSPVVSPSGMHYYIIFIDHLTRFTWCYPMEHKSDTLNKFNQFYAYIQNAFHKPLITFHADEGGEFHKLESTFINLGIQFRYFCPGTPQQNGIDERKNQHIADKIRCLLFQARMPFDFWVEALQYVVHLINILPTTNLNNISPHEALFATSPNYSNLRVFGCLCSPNLVKHTTTKSLPRSLPCIFLGPSHIHKGFRCLNLVNQRVYVSRHIRFSEHVFPYVTFYHHLFPTSPELFPTNYNFNVPFPDHHTMQPTIPSVPTDPNIPSLLLPITAPPSSPPAPPRPSPFSAQERSIHSSNTTTPIPSHFSSHSPTPAPASPPTSPVPTPPIATTNAHSMVTRGKLGIVKPRTILSLSSKLVLDPTSPLYVPTSYNDALKFPHWRHAMTEEYNALIHNRT